MLLKELVGKTIRSRGLEGIHLKEGILQLTVLERRDQLLIHVMGHRHWADLRTSSIPS
jgi:hypothetical protein